MLKLLGPRFCPHKDCRTPRKWKFRFRTPQTQKNKQTSTHTHTHMNTTSKLLWKGKSKGKLHVTGNLADSSKILMWDKDLDDVLFPPCLVRALQHVQWKWWETPSLSSKASHSRWKYRGTSCLGVVTRRLIHSTVVLFLRAMKKNGESRHSLQNFCIRKCFTLESQKRCCKELFCYALVRDQYFLSAAPQVWVLNRYQEGKKIAP